MPDAQYDPFAEIYDVWVSTSPVTEENLRFYVDLYCTSENLIVELGVGNGRIAIEAAKRGATLVGVDASRAMLDLCRERAQRAGVAERLELVQADMRDFQLKQPARLITVPFNTFGHLVELSDKRFGLKHIFDQLAPGGRLVLDLFVFDAQYALGRYAIPQPRAEYRDLETGLDGILWTVSQFDLDRQQIRIFSWTDLLNESGILLQRKYRRLDFSWATPDQMRELLLGVGFELEAVYGDFSRGALAADSRQQIWCARRPTR
jgi:SAM-dependent methyltransferase